MFVYNNSGLGTSKWGISIIHNMINVLVADDSAFMRLAIDKMLSRDPEFNVIGFCSNGEEVLEKLKTLQPDVLTLDIEMPKMNGLEVLDKIMKTRPIPILMVSSLTVEGAEETIKALELGAVDVVAKPGSFVSLKITDIFEELSRKIKAAAKAKVYQKPLTLQIHNPKLKFLAERIKERAERIAKEINLKDYKPLINIPTQQSEEILESFDFTPELIILGISTGGPISLQKIIPELPADLPCGVIIAQHMPLGFTKTLSQRLDFTSKIEVKEAEDGDVIKPGRVLVAPSGFQTRVKKRFVGYSIQVTDETEKNYLYKPCIDILLSSAAEMYKNKVLGIIMTGMGNDGSKGALEINKAGGKIFAQSEDSCVVSSMPAAVIKAGVADKIYSLEQMSKAIIQLFQK